MIDPWFAEVVRGTTRRDSNIAFTAVKYFTCGDGWAIPDEEPRQRLDRIRARRERRKAIEHLAEENPEMAAKVLRTWLKSE